MTETIRMPGQTVLLIDVSKSMERPAYDGVATRLDVANSLAVQLRELCGPEIQIYTFSDQLVLIPPRRNEALKRAINGSQLHRASVLGDAVLELDTMMDPPDRLIIITDEESPEAKLRSWNMPVYHLNVAEHDVSIVVSMGYIAIVGTPTSLCVQSMQ